MTHAYYLHVARIDGAIDFDPQRLAVFLSRKFGETGDMTIMRVGCGQSNPT